jgi:protein phosphatase
MKIRVGAKSDIGRSRERNEDSFLVREPMYAVADGMGGHRGGNVASAMALETLQEVADSRQLTELVEKVKQANARVLERGEADSSLQGMGTTLTAVVADGAKAYLVHIGDSRAYLLRDGELQQLTKDHTLVQRMVDEGRLTKEEAEHHPQRNMITRALGADPDAEPDPMTLDLHHGDRLLLCTDGLTGMVDTDRIQEILETEADPQAACDRLVEAANASGGEDNITVIVLDFEEDRGANATESSAVQSTGSAGAGLPVATTGGGQAVATASRTSTQQPTRAEPGLVTTPARESDRRWRRFAVWSALVVALVVVAIVGVRTYVDHQWYVGEAGGHVAIYNGIPTKILGFALSHVRESTNLSSSDAERLAPWRKLHDGITANSLADARSIVRQITQDLQQTREPGG